ncbi:phosphoribosylglycinamide formyltransferase [Porphyromonadaceae bacterium]
MAIKLALFASGSGSNAENIIRFFAEKHKIEVVLVVSSRSDAFVLDRAERLNIPSCVLTRDDMNNTPDKVMGILKEYQVDFIVLAGYLLKVPDYLIHAFPNAIINIHPALLPKYGVMYGDMCIRRWLPSERIRITIHYVISIMTKDRLFSKPDARYCLLTLSAMLPEKYELEYAHFPK